MSESGESTRNLWARLLPMILVVLLTGNLTMWAQSPAPQPAPVPQWQIDAGGKMAFDVASVKKNVADISRTTTSSNIQLGSFDTFVPTGGYFHATNYPLLQYIIFAYKLTSTEMQSVDSQLPKWANGNRYNIEARTHGNPTKDQYRLMMQALLADRFKLAVHSETKKMAVLALILDKPGKLGPHLRLHPSDAKCPPESSADAIDTTVAGGFPEACGHLRGDLSDSTGRETAGGRNVSLLMFSTMFYSSLININRPVIDRTGIAGNIDFTIDFSPDPQPGTSFRPDPTGPTFLEALKDQLGLWLESTTAPIETVVIDHIEEPSPN